MTQAEIADLDNRIADLDNRIFALGGATANSIAKQNQAIIKLHGDIAETNKKLDSLKSYLDNDIKKDIDLIISTQIKELEDKLNKKKLAKPMGDDVRSMYIGGFKKKRKTKRRKRKRKGTRKKS